MNMNPNVAFLAPVYEYNPIAFIGSLIAQRYSRWNLFLIHDGPCRYVDIAGLVKQLNDPRISFIETPERRQQFGHPIRQQYLEMMKNNEIAQDCEYITITNADNYYAPSFCDMLLHIGLLPSSEIAAAFCSQMVHNYWNWNTVDTSWCGGRIDIGGVMFRKEVPASIGWNDMSHSSDWALMSAVLEKYGAGCVKQVSGNLLVHN